MKSAPSISIYTDGACEGNPGPGGYAAIIDDGETRRELTGAEPRTTNNRMELMAAIVGLEALGAPSEVKLTSDSQYVVKGMTEWIGGWRRRGWRTSSGGAVKNKDLWQRLDRLAKEHRVRFLWVRGHAGHPENERADQLAREAIGTLRDG